MRKVQFYFFCSDLISGNGRSSLSLRKYDPHLIVSEMKVNCEFNLAHTTMVRQPLSLRGIFLNGQCVNCNFNEILITCLSC